LVARLHLPPDRGAVVQQPPVAQRVALARRLDLDDLGAEFAQDLRGKRPGDELAHFQHPDTVQGFEHVHSPMTIDAYPSDSIAPGRRHRPQPAPRLQPATSARPQATPEDQAHWKL